MIKIQLDTAAMDKLFPEGTQARIDLQTSVIASLAGRYLKPGVELEKILNEHKKKAVDEACKDFGLHRARWGGNFELTDGARSSIKDMAVATVNGQVRDLVNLKLKESISEIDRIIDQRVTYEINELVRSKVAAKLKEISSSISQSS